MAWQGKGMVMLGTAQQRQGEELSGNGTVRPGGAERCTATAKPRDAKSRAAKALYRTAPRGLARPGNGVAGRCVATAQHSTATHGDAQQGTSRHRNREARHCEATAWQRDGRNSRATAVRCFAMVWYSSAGLWHTVFPAPDWAARPAGVCRGVSPHENAGAPRPYRRRDCFS